MAKINKHDWLLETALGHLFTLSQILLPPFGSGHHQLKGNQRDPTEAAEWGPTIYKPIDLRDALLTVLDVTFGDVHDALAQFTQRVVLHFLWLEDVP